jgi:predicted SAM-dependent methyltransferase
MRLLSKTSKERLNLIMSHVLFYPYALRYHILKNKLKKLHVGCGKNRFQGWINADINPASDVIIVLQKRLPFKSGSLEMIYSEHVLEHVTYKTAVFFLKEAYRTLRAGGVMRIAMPDLDDIIDGYLNDWKRFDWIKLPHYSFIKTRAEMINVVFYWWGHRHLYNKEELTRALLEAGFTEFKFLEKNKSGFKDLCDRETRADSNLIVEAIKSI